MSKQEALSSFISVLNTLQDSLGSIGISKVEPPILDLDACEEEKREAFREALETLSDVSPDSSLDEASIKRFIGFFDCLYASNDDGGFRHMYSDVCQVMFSFLDIEDLDDGIPFHVVNLENNVTMIKEYAEKGVTYESAARGLRKLQDHISLECNRMRYMAVQNKRHKESIDNLADDFEKKIDATLEEASNSFKNQITETKDALQRNYITILGIFAAVVIAFMSATAFSSSVLQSMANVSIYRLSFAMFALGFFIFNLVCALFAFLGNLTEKQVVARCFVIAVDVAFLACILATFVARMFHLLG